ncbi:hypothetical protein PSN01_00469 [Micromonospora saelicesensis]|nr:hypothetical protein PSN01_00469 [Micromonospora saelicesensis]
MGRSQPRAACMARIMFSRTDRSATIPSARRFSEQKPTPWSMACAGVRRLLAVPSIAT